MTEPIPIDKQAAEAAVAPQPDPVVIHLNMCNFAVGAGPDGMKQIKFVHLTGGAVAFVTLTKEGVDELVRGLTGGVEIAQKIPIVLQ